MSRINKPWVAATLMAFTTSLLTMGSASPASAAAEPAQQVERCGTARDQFFIPASDGSVYYYAYGYPVKAGYHDVVGSAVTVDMYGMEKGSWSFVYTNDPCPAQAADSVGVSVGACDPIQGYTAVAVPYTNTADGTGWSKRGVVMAFSRLGDEYVFEESAGEVLDGQTAVIRPGYDAYRNIERGLLPGAWTIAVKSEGALIASTGVTVAACGDEVPPVDVTEPPAAVKKPKGTLKQLRGTTKMRARMINRGVSSPTKFRLVIDKPGPGKVVKRFTLKPNGLKRKTFPAPARTVFVLKAKVKTVKNDGQVVARMTLLKRMSLRPARS